MNHKSLAVWAILIAIVALIVSFVGPKTASNNTGSSSKDLLTSVLAKGEIRAGYVVYPPAFIKDPNTGELSGIFHDALEQMGKNLGVKITWVDGGGWGTIIEGLNQGKYDIIGNGLWTNSTRAKVVDFSSPLYYSAVGVYTRAGDNRLSDLAKINSSDVTIATIDGEMSSFIAKETFPNAKTVSLPQDTQVSQLLLNVKTKKADVTFVEAAVAEEFLANNAGSIQNLVPTKPIRSFGNTYAVPKNQDSFKSTINTAIEELFNNGAVDVIVKKYEKFPGSLYPVAKPYSIPQ